MPSTRPADRNKSIQNLIAINHSNSINFPPFYSFKTHTARKITSKNFRIETYSSYHVEWRTSSYSPNTECISSMLYIWEMTILTLSFKSISEENAIRCDDDMEMLRKYIYTSTYVYEIH